jgi:hypothetical protein
MRLSYVPAAALLAALAGCSDSKPLPMATTPEAARPALQAALDAWKAGRTPEELRGQSPPVYFNDADFGRGRKLADYSIEGDGTPMGTGLSFAVTLTLQGNGKPTPRKLAYRVATQPTVSIYREDS